MSTPGAVAAQCVIGRQERVGTRTGKVLCNDTGMNSHENISFKGESHLPYKSCTEPATRSGPALRAGFESLGRSGSNSTRRTWSGMAQGAVVSLEVLGRHCRQVPRRGTRRALQPIIQRPIPENTDRGLRAGVCGSTACSWEAHGAAGIAPARYPQGIELPLPERFPPRSTRLTDSWSRKPMLLRIGRRSISPGSATL